MPRTLLIVGCLLLAGGGAGAQTETHVWRPESGGGPWAINGDLTLQGALRFELRAGDRAPWDVEHQHPAERAEVSDYRHKEPIGRTIRFSFDLMVEPGSPATSRWLVLGQLHPSNEPPDIGPSPAWAQELDAGDVFRIVVRHSSEHPILHNPPALVVFEDRAFKRGHRYHFDYVLRYSLTDGVLQGWRDGHLVANYHGPLGYTDPKGPFFKFGIYREPSAETIAVHYTNLRIRSD